MKFPGLGGKNVMSEKVTAVTGNKQITIETGKLAKQADGAVVIQLGETIVLVAAVAAVKAKEGQDFFPLTVDYRERAASAGRFPGGYFKREGRPTEKEILTCRLTDRPIRPLFPKGWYNEVQVQSIVLSADGENDPDILSIMGASAALMVSDIPWAGPLGAVRVARTNGVFIANPSHAERVDSDLDLIYVGSEKDVVMFEGSANEITEADFAAALKFGHEACQPLIAAQKELAQKVGRAKRQISLKIVPEEILLEAKRLAGDRMIAALLTPAKMARESAVKAIQDEVGAKLVEKFGADKVTDFVVSDAFYYIQKESVRGLLMNEQKRLDGRTLDQVRPISGEVSVLPRAHGSAIFTRGETQTVALVTLGTSEDAQEFDAYTGGDTTKKFILHYNFPNFSVGETGRISGPGRREIGHGALAERSIEPMLPLKEYPYAVRVTSEIMESNGSSSMATVCGATLALMDAGVPIKRPVSGISIGLCTESDASGITRSLLLTDIIGWEDGFCDMDCKIAGTEVGITGFQLDLKLKGIPHDLMVQALEKARVARLFILEEMKKVLPAPRTELSKYAPRIETVRISPEKIGALIGPGGKNIKRIVEESGCEINIEDDGTVNIYSTSAEGMKIARDAISGQTAEAEIGKIYRGRVVTIKEFGCFVEFLPGKDGLVHISELANFRVKQTEDIVKLGDEIMVKCLGVDEKGRVRLSRKAAMADRDKEVGEGQAPAAGEPAEGADRPERGERAERSERPERPERFERADRPERAPAERSERADRPERAPAERFERADRPERPAERTYDRPSERPERPADRPAADRPADRFVDRPAERPERPSERPERPADRPRGERPPPRQGGGRRPSSDRGPRD
jgi:polyribonucleotide nucleotidyltransferase